MYIIIHLETANVWQWHMVMLFWCYMLILDMHTLIPKCVPFVLKETHVVKSHPHDICQLGLVDIGQRVIKFSKIKLGTCYKLCSHMGCYVRVFFSIEIIFCIKFPSPRLRFFFGQPFVLVCTSHSRVLPPLQVGPS